MGRIFSIQAKDTDKFRRNTRRKLRKGDVVRIFGTIANSQVTKELDLRPKTKDILFSKNFKRTLKNQPSIVVVEMGGKPL